MEVLRTHSGAQARLNATSTGDVGAKPGLRATIGIESRCPYDLQPCETYIQPHCIHTLPTNGGEDPRTALSVNEILDKLIAEVRTK